MSRTFVMCKPDAVERKLVGEIIRRLEESGLSILAAELRTLNPEILAKHYEEHVEKPFYDDLVTFMSRSPAMLMVLEGEGEAYATARALMGATDPAEADAGTIRGDLGSEMPENLIHGSDSEESAEREISIFFPEL
ncbi:MAG: nucleoside-diphosphate kinase [Acidimicrobiales bacterium]|nr:nucleoside-diphosphate kinase [Acidimicrobiales bacterium]